MRTAGEIKRELIHLVYAKRLPRVKICEDSRCSNYQFWSALKLEASETVLRRFDAYLDATHLHKHGPGSMLLKKIEDIRHELYYEYNARSLPMADFQIMPPEKQKWLLGRMHWRAKRLLRARIREQTGREPYFADGSNYWICKKKVAAILAENPPGKRVLATD